MSKPDRLEDAFVLNEIVDLNNLASDQLFIVIPIGKDHEVAKQTLRRITKETGSG